MDFGRGERLVLSKVAMYEVEAIQTDYEETIKYLGIINKRTEGGITKFKH